MECDFKTNEKERLKVKWSRPTLKSALFLHKASLKSDIEILKKTLLKSLKIKTTSQLQ